MIGDNSRPGDAGADISDSVLAVLARFTSRITAQSILRLARERSGNLGRRLDCTSFRAMLGTLERQLWTFVPERSKVEECRRQLEALVRDAQAAPSPSPIVIQIRVEEDIVQARNEARKLAARIGFTQVGQTRLATAVSELARNIFQYVGEGQIQVSPTSPPGIDVVAKDNGPGIPNLEQILIGNYKSKLGMGLGLRGVKRIAERFEVQTGAGKGTTVSFHLRVT
jgi:serine/threonine-protein kinase RsbT